ncbi:MAG TPA: GDSL-type esterase/lipase family protein [Nitrospiraceae bacterium]|nr:GDSL-type esterase/lipase family protein [Nitrospiraceae bacterium]
MRDASSISIICFGDSLTAGYQSPTYDVPYIVETPYGMLLQERLGAQATVMTCGVCGEVTRDMVLRFQRDVVAYRPDYVVILGGTNDLGCHVASTEVFSNLCRLYDQASAAGIRPVAVTVPSIRMEINLTDRHWLNGFLMQRQHLNRLILDYCAKHAMACVDLFTATIEPDTLLLADPYSNDGLHLTTKGYRKMADLLYEQVFHGRVHGQHE